MNDTQFQQHLTDLRPQLHRYCARMVGSTIDGEDVLQETMIKALCAERPKEPGYNIDGWLYRIAHNTSIDFLRARSRSAEIPISDDFEVSTTPQPEIVTIGFQTFLRLPELQRCAVILKDVLGHSVEEIADVTTCSVPAVKSALQRGRLTLRRLASEPEDARVPLLTSGDRERLVRYVSHFRAGEFDAIRSMLSDDVKLELVNRLTLKGQDKVAAYFTRYSQEPRWRFVFGSVEGRPAMLVFDDLTKETKPSHFALIEWRGEQIVGIRDFLFASYAVETLEWARLA